MVLKGQMKSLAATQRVADHAARHRSPAKNKKNPEAVWASGFYYTLCVCLYEP